MVVLPNISRSYSRVQCIICARELVGRRDKKFCSLECKNAYHKIRRAQNHQTTAETDQRLHRNRTILAELHEEAASSKFITPRNRLIRKGFSFQHHTSLSINKEGKQYFHIYDYAWMAFSSTDVMIVHKKKRRVKTQQEKYNVTISLPA